MTVVAALIDNEPLSQVVFVHDYVQLVFQDTTLFGILLNVRSVVSRQHWMARSWLVRCVLVALIGQSVNSVDYLPRDHLGIHLRRQRSQDMLAGLACDV